jgi:hypothetical protein
MDLGRYTVLAIIFGQKDIVDVRRRSNGGEDREDESLRSSLVNHKTCRSWVKTPRQATKRDVVV